MMYLKKIFWLIFILPFFVTSCQPKSSIKIFHSCQNFNDTLYVRFYGNADAVQFKMFEGLNFMLRKKSERFFEGYFASEDIDDAIFSYDIIAYSLDSAKNYINLNYRKNINGVNFFTFFGKNRKTNFQTTNLTKGKIIRKDIESKYLDESRRLSIYYPPKYDINVPVFYLTDGSIIDEYAKYVDALISSKIIKPIILIGVHSSKEHRYEEYVEGFENNSYFIKHKDFFIKEVLKSVEQEIENWCGKRYIYGFSNGAAFCMYMGINHPDLFKEVISFSTADYISEFNKPIEFNFKKYPKFYMGAGKFEESIYNDNKKFSSKMQNQNINVQFKTFISGHDFNVWRYEFLEHILREFKYK